MMNSERQKTILLVEDEAIIAMTEKMTLEKFGYQVIIAHSGEEAVATVKKMPGIDLILMDIDLGTSIDGSKTAEIILRERDLPVVFLSAHTEPEIVARTEKITSYGYVVKNSGDTVLQASIKMAFKLFESKIKEKIKGFRMETALAALKTAEETYRNIFLNAQIGLFRTDIKSGLLLDANDCVARFIGYKDRKELLAMPFNIAERYVDDEDRQKMVSLLQEHGEFNNFEAQFKRNDGSLAWMRYSSKIVPEKGWIEGVSEDITKEKAMEASLRESEEKYRILIENSHDIIYTLSPNGIFTFVSPSWTTLLGHPSNQVVGKPFRQFVHPDDLAVCMTLLQKVIGLGQRQKGIDAYRVRHADGSWRWHVTNAVPIRDASGTIVGGEGIARDITEHKQDEEEIQRQLAEKEILLKEVHHRIKNNIASIAGLLSLRLQSIRNPEAITVLQEAIGRMNSMRLLYDKLLLSGNVEHLAVKNYAESLALMVVSSFSDKAKVKLDQRIDDFSLAPKRLFPLGIIINELLTNIMKYAFTNKKSGRIQLSLAKAGSRVTLVIQDDGVGIPAGSVAGGEKGFGLTLVKMLSQQLGGSFAIEKDKGTRCMVTFDI